MTQLETACTMWMNTPCCLTIFDADDNGKEWIKANYFKCRNKTTMECFDDLAVSAQQWADRKRDPEYSSYIRSWIEDIRQRLERDEPDPDPIPPPPPIPEDCDQCQEDLNSCQSTLQQIKDLLN